jgi:TIGR00252 family protein
MYDRHIIGEFGENIIEKYLASIDYEIIYRNFRCRQGEIDIVAKDKDELVFIEVKTRTSNIYGRPVEAVTERKKRNIINASNYFVYKNNLTEEYIRFDVIEVFLNRTYRKINHIKKAFFENDGVYLRK